MTRGRLTEARIRGYRSLADCKLDLDDQLTVIMGGNATGKSSLLDGIQLAADVVREGGRAFEGPLRGSNAKPDVDHLLSVFADRLNVKIDLEFEVEDRVFSYSLEIAPEGSSYRIAEELLYEIALGPEDGLLAQRDNSGARIRRGEASESRVEPVGLSPWGTALSLGADPISSPLVHPAWRFITGICSLRLIPLMMRAKGDPSADLGLPDLFGRDLASRLHALQTNRPRSVPSWVTYMEGFVGWSELRTPVQQGWVSPSFLEGACERPISLMQMSDGSAVFASFATLAVDPPTGVSMYLVDEPGVPFHPRDMQRIAEPLKVLAATRQVVVATNSRELTNELGNLDNVRQMQRHAGEASVITRLPANDADLDDDIALRGIGEAAFDATPPMSEKDD